MYEPLNYKIPGTFDALCFLEANTASCEGFVNGRTLPALKSSGNAAFLMPSHDAVPCKQKQPEVKHEPKELSARGLFRSKMKQIELSWNSHGIGFASEIGEDF